MAVIDLEIQPSGDASGRSILEHALQISHSLQQVHTTTSQLPFAGASAVTNPEGLGTLLYKSGGIFQITGQGGLGEGADETTFLKRKSIQCAQVLQRSTVGLQPQLLRHTIGKFLIDGLGAGPVAQRGA